MSIDRWMDKDVACIHNGILLGHEQMDPTIRDNMDGHKGYYIKWNKSETNTEILPIHGI